MKSFAEGVFLKASRGATSRLRLVIYRLLGLKLGLRNRMEGGGRVLNQLSGEQVVTR